MKDENILIAKKIFDLTIKLNLQAKREEICFQTIADIKDQLENLQNNTQKADISTHLDRI